MHKGKRVWVVFAFKHLLVDGWNVIRSRSELRRVMDRDGWQAARAELARILAPIHDFAGVRVTIVYDGQGESASIERPKECGTFSEVFTPSSMTADELIERLCARSDNPSEIMVATRDNLIRVTSASFGSCGMSVDDLMEMASRTECSLERSAYRIGRENFLEWKKANPFAKLDKFELELKGALSGHPLISKRLKKKLKRLKARQENGE